MAFRFGSKGETLERLRPQLHHAVVLDQVRFSVADWNAGPEKILAEVLAKPWSAGEMIVRSSALGEDSLTTSQAGAYLSVPNVLGETALGKAIADVFGSFPDLDPNHQVMVQPMLGKVTMAGVVFTADLDTLAPYYTVNFERGGGTHGVTSGSQTGLETYIRFRNTPFPVPDPQIAELLAVCEDCERITGHPYLDIEFAFDDAFGLVILQIRPIVSESKSPPKLDGDLDEPLRKLYRKILKLSAPHPNLLGDRAIYGVMPDWNPAEIVGRRPRPLALSLYRELVTDQIWAYQRDNYGYRNLRSHPLLVSFLGLPYIDVRVSFNSFIPESLHPEISKKLANHYLDALAASPQQHDKVEFEIVHSCYYLNLPHRLQKYLGSEFSSNERKRIEFSLLELSNHIIDPERGLYRKDLDKVTKLETRHAAIVESGLSKVDKIYWLLEECKRFGTLPFAGIARAAFVAVQSLNALVTQGVLNQDERQRFLNSLSTVSKALARDLHHLGKGGLERGEFLAKYGHLRPGSYDILSPRYDQAFDIYFGQEPAPPGEDKPFHFSDAQQMALTRLLREHGIQVDTEAFLDFMVAAIEGREYAKFVFTKTLSDVLELIAAFGEKLDIDREALSFLDIQEVRQLYAKLDSRDVGDIFMENIERNRAAYAYTQTVKLPSLIVKAEEVYHFYKYNDEPNFITLESVTGETITERQFSEGTFEGKIAFITSADPGYDFLFTKGIAGLVTQYGGANSHMAIRCAELGLPAVIGAGSRNFEAWSRASQIALDCQTRQVRVLR